MISPSPKESGTFRQVMAWFIIFTLITTTIGPLPKTHAQGVSGLPQAGEFLTVSPVFATPHLMGLTTHPENPLVFDFILNRGDASFGMRN